ncbi:MAG: acetolactate synthase small subunit [Porticoccaceae bacterium]|nr:acetolactate synthase small subunit [Porticoccaceae bacterium]|tara:strand:+ start:2685 stop:3179 length:495 start_codon:yes stop_codon:yes gene_type:complete
MRRIISVLLENESGALSRVVGLFSQRGYNIDTLTVAPTEDESLSRLTLTTTGDERMAEQIVKQLHKLIDTLKVNELTQGSFVERELLLIKIAASESYSRAEIMRCVEIFRGNIVDVTAATFTLQLLGNSEKLDAFLEAIKHIGSIEVVRSGVVGVARGDKFLRQ